MPGLMITAVAPSMIDTLVICKYIRREIMLLHGSVKSKIWFEMKRGIGA